MNHSLLRLAALGVALLAVAAPASVAQPDPAQPAPIQTAAGSALPIPVIAVREFPPAVYKADRQNWNIAQDDRGILYVANDSGVLEFDGTRWRLIELPNKGRAYALVKAGNGRIFVGGNGEFGWLAPDASGTMTYVSRSADLPADFRASADHAVQILDTPGGPVFLSEHWLFVRKPDGSYAAFRSEDHFLQVSWLDGVLYVLDSARGLMRLEGGSLRDIPGGSHIRGLTMLVTDGSLVIPSFNDGLLRFRPGAPNPWQVLSPGTWSAADVADVTSSVLLSPNLFAFGTAKRGVALTDGQGNLVERIAVAEGLSDVHVYSVATDGRGGLWLSLDAGLSLIGLRLPPNPGTPPFRALVREVIGTRDDRRLFGGTFFATPGGVQQATQGPSQHLSFPHKYNAFRLAYSANGLESSGATEFQTFVTGVDNAYSSWSTRSEREFTQLSAGRWTFKVRARKPDGTVSSEGTYEFEILEAWYDTWWFAAFQIVFVLGLLLAPGHTTNKFVQDALTTLAVIIPFVYLADALSGVINHYYSTEVGFIRTLMSALLAFALDPAQGGLKKLVERRNERQLRRKSEQTSGPG